MSLKKFFIIVGIIIAVNLVSAIDLAHLRGESFSSEIIRPFGLTVQSRKNITLQEETEMCMRICWECFKDKSSSELDVRCL